MSIISLRIKELRKTNGFTQEELAAKLRKNFNLKTDRVTISRWESGSQVPEMYALGCLAKIFDVTIDYLNGTEGNYVFEIGNIIQFPKTKKIPLIGQIACGEPILADQNIESYINMPENVNGSFALRCKGDSMINARIFDGDVVFINPDLRVENGQIAAVRIDNEATLKRVYRYDNRLELRPENPTFKVLNFEGAELENVEIIGKAVGFLSTII